MHNRLRDLHQWGWRPFFEDQFHLPSDPHQIARITIEHRDHYSLINGAGESIGGLIPGNWKKRQTGIETPAVGDWVSLSRKTGDRHGVPYYLIDRRLNRYSQILRKAAGQGTQLQVLAANVDLAFIVSSCDQDFDLRRIERYLSLITDVAIKPILILNKCDLPNHANYFELLQTRFNQIPIVTTQTDKPDTIYELYRFFELGTTCVLLGSSGVGKSTIINALLGESRQDVQSVRLRDSKGRHTTTTRSMFLLPNQKGLIIDIPGLREIQLPPQQVAFDEAFRTITELAIRCRFTDCRHKTEPNCAVKEAVTQGLVTEAQLLHFHQLSTEVEKPSTKRKRIW